MRVDAESAEGKLGHCGLTDDRCASLAQPAYHFSILFGRLGIGENARAGKRLFTFDVKQIFNRNRQTGERGQFESELVHHVGRVGRKPCCLLIDPGEGSYTFSLWIMNAFKALLDNRSFALKSPWQVLSKAARRGNVIFCAEPVGI